MAVSDNGGALAGEILKKEKKKSILASGKTVLEFILSSWPTLLSNWKRLKRRDLSPKTLQRVGF